jgi:hypothetical protein
MISLVFVDDSGVDETADLGCLEALQPLATKQSARRVAAAWKNARTSENDLDDLFAVNTLSFESVTTDIHKVENCGERQTQTGNQRWARS